MSEVIIRDANERMNKTMETLKHDMAKIRTGRAHPSLLEHIMVSYYGSDVPINQVANINVQDARTLSVTVWDKNAIVDVEKAIMNSDLGLNPMSAGDVLRIPLPPLTEDRRKELIKVVRAEAEKARVAIRNIRRDANNQLKAAVKEKGISEDEERRAEERVQKITDSHVADIDKILETKEQELMEI